MSTKEKNSTAQKQPCEVVATDSSGNPTRMRCFCGHEVDAADKDGAEARIKALYSRLSDHYRAKHEQSRQDVDPDGLQDCEDGY